jgi:hypothetical protein
MAMKATSIGGARKSGRGGNTPQKQVNDQVNIITSPPVLPPPEDPTAPPASPPKLNRANPPIPLPIIRAWKEQLEVGQPIPPGRIIRLVIRGGRARV